MRSLVVSAADAQADPRRDRALAIAYDGGEAMVTFPDDASAGVACASLGSAGSPAFAPRP